MIRLLTAFLAACALICLASSDGESMQPKKVPPRKVEPPDTAVAAYVGTWKMTAVRQKYEEEFTVTHEQGKWKLTGVYKVEGKVVGRFHGEKFAFGKNGLSFSYVIDEKPPFDLFATTRGVLSAKDDKGKVNYTATHEKGTSGWNRPFERTERGMVAQAEPKPGPKPDPKVDPKPEAKPEPKTADVEKPAGPYSVVATIKGVHNGVLSPDGQTLYALSLDAKSKGLVVFDVKKKEVVKRVGLSFPDRVRVSDDGKVLAVCDYQNYGQKDYYTKVLVYDTATWETLGEFDHPMGASLLAISADGSRVAVGAHGMGPDNKGNVNVWNVAAKKVLFTTSITSYAAMDLSADGKTLVVNAFGPDKMSIGFIDVDTGKPKAAVKGLAEHLTVSPDGKFAVGSHGNKLTVYDAVKKTPRELPPPGVGGALQVSLIDGGKRVVSGSSVAETSVVVLASGKVEHSFTLEPAAGEKLPKGAKPPKGGAKIYQAAFQRATPDSSYLLTVGADRVARVWTLPFGPK